MKNNSLGILVATLLLATSALAQTASPVGLWKNIDDTTGKPKALIRITESNGEFSGKIEKLYREAPEELNPKCVKCEGDNKDKPIIGMTMLQGMKADGADYDGGTILDPANGKVYKSKMTLIEDGKKLNVRGYIGLPLIGRTQTWVREQ
ncbi:DUF2147 domain-containing protein [Glaciimonas immobilis]|uniref:Uncharacterized protein (DUF2147 family) n=1 Tax=Glaciimonas immobilis TaxID=728004 RepID=A0A840RT39_9BURK|nr:DUF2147 domain-containing protein [Glaciimonas immobilis]KAF3997358.1 DUF2147 domain-containing protein [Glaciimonas immobilis]MBB5200985.1 uncharacterized protein (DUF2147 family) [Glaciimonas immobilis]